jgi:hypothetical protein
MPRPKDKGALLEAAASAYDSLTSTLSDIPAGLREDTALQAAIDDQSRNPRDVVAHLHAWQVMTMAWCRIGESGGMPHVPGAGRTWRDTPVINAEIWQQFAATPYADALALLDESHHEMVRVIEAHTQEQLFGAGVYPWTKSTTLGAYFVSATSSHYVWGTKTLRAILRSL